MPNLLSRTQRRAPDSRNLLEPTDPLLTVAEAAVHLGKGVSTTHRMVKSGSLPQPLKLGGPSR